MYRPFHFMSLQGFLDCQGTSTSFVGELLIAERDHRHDLGEIMLSFWVELDLLLKTGTVIDEDVFITIFQKTVAKDVTSRVREYQTELQAIASNYSSRC